MRNEIMTQIQSEQDWHRFLHEQPYWYRKLSRNPKSFDQFKIAALNYHQKTIPHQVEKFTNGVQMASMMVNMFQAMNTSD
ncbi:hypothetical protein Q75_05510 [Bacillus coahuilensis p1.1.43]|uniref:YlbE-like protein n=1 Tax=Bacillus coahuilensis p1.1.43 TaxID=1150625 RepID=A0A147KA24_9BACI|nr:YlbE-like family protein [Bacillus coahuilensis]KUP07315.1 hypothetical protein Q75_05510 [Bacillus coahuilensis p1.1.43]